MDPRDVLREDMYNVRRRILNYSHHHQRRIFILLLDILRTAWFQGEDNNTLNRQLETVNNILENTLNYYDRTGLSHVTNEEEDANDENNQNVLNQRIDF